MTPELKTLTDMKWQLDCSKTKMPPNYVPKDRFTDRTANGLTKCIITWLQINGWQSERINTMGRMIDKRHRVTNVLGQSYTIGSIGYIPTTSTKGSADISATVKGHSWKIEVKIGADRQSPEQIRYQQDIERAGGIYLIARDFTGFIKDYKRLIEI